MERSIDELIELLNDKDDFVVEDVMGELELRKEESLDPLIDALSHRKKGVRLHAATLLGAIGDPKAIPALIDTLKDNNKLVRREASTALSRMGQPALDPLIETLADEDWRVRGAAAWALGNIGDEKAIPELEKLLDDESGFVRQGAQSAIASIKK
ncbi:MAG: HEAT repeat domain-containing protein [Methanobrevibacter sp.]|uniref:HEAT repeat domain-containing protein n=1 Tax=Methanobrevibacter sp. TaxID=66852 RepID=UPI0025EA740C|nr:HEAT repeat domain-containing protein [Methanobrevibacter sp.]MBE6508207.1 HEAT repeat domain-containing protein [Methanobrevibacter sp.]